MNCDMPTEHDDHPGLGLSHSPLTRRQALGRLGAGALLALGAWPGALRAADTAAGEDFRFLVVNDTHAASPECGGYLEGLARQMRSEDGDFLLHCGDVTDKGEARYFGLLKDSFDSLGRRLYPVIGNHDYTSDRDRSAYIEAFRLRINYYFRHRGWQFLGLDSSDGTRYEKTQIQPETFAWLDDNLRRLDPRKPTVLFTHFPLGAGVRYRPENADALLERLLDFNLQAVFCGHYHGFTERTRGRYALTTNRCCALRRGNHDGTKEKGYFVCEAKAGLITRRFVEYKPAASSKS
jgi:predicted phosphodiesterase